MTERYDSTSPGTQTVCYRHPSRPTGLSCTECDKPICVECSHDAPVGQKCPDCAKLPGRYRVVNARAAQNSAFAGAPFSAAMTAAIVAIFVIGFLFRDIGNQIETQFAQFNSLVAAGEWWRILTAAMLHSRSLLVHVGFNAYAIYLFGPQLERRIGSPAFATLYVASAAAGGAAAFLFGRGGLGASGAVFGLFGAWFFVSYKTRKTVAGRHMFNRMLIILALNAALPIFIPFIGWEAHAGGFLAGLIISFLWSKMAAGKPNAKTLRVWIALPVLLLSILSVIVLQPLNLFG